MIESAVSSNSNGSLQKSILQSMVPRAGFADINCSRRVRYCYSATGSGRAAFSAASATGAVPTSPSILDMALLLGFAVEIYTKLKRRTKLVR